ncbi:2,3-bisphosphoglycerate-independent phosphoglycerate mutase 1 [uncultured archaeon]|nr:2,3-bisphosphoglycerate-independent phosphoglycerate mutase 1 [uncultured archaeon]
MAKALFIICDGLGDRPIKEFNGKTPLEAAKTPNLDRLAREGITGLMHTLGVGIRPGSDTATLTLLGYEVDKYYSGRGPFEAAGIGMDLRHGDVAFRGNVATVDDNLIIKDRRAGRPADTVPYVEALGERVKVEDVEFFLKPGTGHRIGVVMHGPGLSAAITDPDPHEVGLRVVESSATDGSPEAKKTARILNAFLLKCHQVLKDIPENKKRVAEGKPPVNFVLVRGAGVVTKIPPFQERYHMKAACVAGAGLYKGVAKAVGFDILDCEGATGKPDTNVRNKFLRAKKAFEEGYEYVFVHVKAADNLAEDGNFEGKKAFIEKIDAASDVLLSMDDTVIALTGDHSTSCTLKAHTGDPVPIFMWGPGVRPDGVQEFGERPCMTGGLGHIKGSKVLQEILNLLGKQHLVGA